MRYTQGQIRDLVGVSIETLRTWRGVVPFLGERKGHSPTFTAGDLIAFAALAELVGTFGVRIGSISAQAQTLFELCHGQSWLALEGYALVMNAESVRLVRSDTRGFIDPEPSWVVSCSTLIARLRGTLTETDLADQGRLQFPPLAVGARP